VDMHELAKAHVRPRCYRLERYMHIH